MNCKELVDFLMNYLDGELPAPVREEFESHLRLCPPCMVFLEQYRQTVRLGKSCKEGGKCKQQVPEDLVQAILKARSMQPKA
jgi:anti-sigma factor RsiW